MSDITRVALDAMGGDNAPLEMVYGAALAVKDRSDIRVILVGDEAAIEAELKKYPDTPRDRIDIRHTSEVIETAEHPVNAIKRKKDSSMVVGLKMVHEGEADAFVSCGNSGALLVGGQLIAGRVPGVMRAPFAPLIPTKKGVTLVLDCGANVDARADHLVQFARMGSIYMEYMCGKKNPTVGIVNVGAEEEKGNALVKETFPLLKECSNINFIGSVEARDIPSGDVDVVVCEGFVGNVILKLYEGLAGTLISVIKKGLMSSLLSKIGAAMALPALKKTLKEFDATEYGGAPLLGLRGLVVKAHGNATHKEIKNAIIQCVTFSQQGIVKKIEESLSEADS